MKLALLKIISKIMLNYYLQSSQEGNILAAPHSLGPALYTLACIPHLRICIGLHLGKLLQHKKLTRK